MPPLVSVIVPVKDDAQPLAALLADLPADDRCEIIVAAARPVGAALREVRARFAGVRWVESARGRGVQMNAGAACARGEWLWFVHADSRPPRGWLDAFRRLDTSTVGGAFAFALDSRAWQARLLERGVRLRVRWWNLPYGDQGIFVRRRVFEAIGGFAGIPLMEDVEFIDRLKRAGPLRHLSLQLTTSARRWEHEGWLRRSLANLWTLTQYRLGVSPVRLARRYYGQNGRGAISGPSEAGDAHQETR